MRDKTTWQRLLLTLAVVITTAVASMLNTPVATAATGEHEGFTPIAQTTQVGERSQAQVDAEFAAIITDLVGTPIRLLDANGTTTWTNQASTWGATDANTAMPLRFAGQYHDTETGLHYNLNRYDNPDTGRYITADPLGLAPSPNPHTYVTNPTTAIDPLGLSEVHGLHENATKTATHSVPIGLGSEKAWTVLNRVDAKAAPLPGYKGGSVFKNTDGKLPESPGVTYREWDVNPYTKGVNRGSERIVTGSDGSAYWTGDHYDSFLMFRGPIG